MKLRQKDGEKKRVFKWKLKRQEENGNSPQKGRSIAQSSEEIMVNIVEEQFG